MMEPEDDVVKSDCCCCGENLNSRALVQQESGLRVPIAPMSLWSTPSQMSGIKPTKPEGDHDDDDPFLTTTLHHMAIKLGCFKHHKRAKNGEMVCPKCVAKLIKAYHFRKTCLRNEKRTSANNSEELDEEVYNKRRHKERTKKHSKRSTISKVKNKKKKSKLPDIETVKKIVTDCLKDQGILKEKNPVLPDILSPLSKLTLQDKSDKL